ncbi:hypothetical protein ACFL0A_01590 [Patescibacteria group bacterium]
MKNLKTNARAYLSIFWPVICFTILGGIVIFLQPTTNTESQVIILILGASIILLLKGYELGTPTRIAKKLGLEDEGKLEVGDNKCPECGEQLRLGRDKDDYIQSYCPKCEEIIETIFIPKHRPGVKLRPHSD